MIRTGKVLSSEVAANKDGDTDVRLLTVELSDSDDIQTIEYYDDGGGDYRPPGGAEEPVKRPRSRKERTGRRHFERAHAEARHGEGRPGGGTR